MTDSTEDRNDRIDQKIKDACKPANLKDVRFREFKDRALLPIRTEADRV